MADVKITQLAPGSALNGTELFESVQAGQSVRLSAAQIAQYVESEAFGNVITVGQGGTGSQSLTGYVFGQGVAPLEGRPTIPNTDITGLGTATVTGQANVTLTGLTASGQVGDVQIAAGAQVFPTGVTATGQVGFVVVTTSGAILYWNGFWWQTYPLKVWDGVSWVQKPVRHWTGSAWE